MPETDPLKIKALLERQSEGESLSFQSLISELGDMNVGEETVIAKGGTAPHAPGGLRDVSHLDTEISDAPTMLDAERAAEAARRRAELDYRVLTESSSRRTPIWLQTLLLGGLADLLLLPIVGGSGFIYFQPWYSLAVCFFSSVTVFWSLYGLVRIKPHETAGERWLCLIGLGLAVLAGVVAFMLRTPTPMPMR